MLSCGSPEVGVGGEAQVFDPVVWADLKVVDGTGAGFQELDAGLVEVVVSGVLEVEDAGGMSSSS